MAAADLGGHIRHLREARGWTQGKFARELEKTQGEVSRWERGEVRPSYDNIVLIAKTLGVPTTAFEGEGATPSHPVAPEPPTVAKLDWMPRLLEKILDDRSLSALEKERLMAEVNAAGMRFWAVAAEWASGQRGMAAIEAEVSSGKRAATNQEEARSASTRALTLRRDGSVTSELPEPGEPMTLEETIEHGDPDPLPDAPDHAVGEA